MRLTCKIEGCEQSPVGRFCVDHIRERMYVHDEKLSAQPRKKTTTQSRTYMLKVTYNMTPDEYAQLLAAQGGGCAICGKTPEQEGRSLSVDHDHKTGVVRGILCAGCNRGLGRFQDEPDRLLSAARYLIDTPAGRILQRTS